jgi:outer membrane protein assembly factor BamB
MAGVARFPGLRRRLLGAGLPTVAVLAVTAALAVPAVRHSDMATTVSVVAGSAPPALPAGPLPAVVRARWSAPPGPVMAVGADGGTVVLADSTGVAGRDPVSGAERWSYHRGNAALCAWTVQDGVVVAVFGKRHGCTDVTALDAGTGARRWYRNADLGPEVDLRGAAGVVVARSGDQLIAMDTATGLNRWTVRKQGCRYDPIALGTHGAVAVLHCGSRTQVVSHDPYADKQQWSVAAPGAEPVVLAIGDRDVAVLAGDRDRKLTLYDGSGHRLGTATDRRLAGPAPADPPTGIEAEGLLLYWTGRNVVAVDRTGVRLRWAAPADGPPTLDGDRVLFAVPGGFVECAPASGRVLRRVRAVGGGPDRGARLARLGRLVVGASRDGTVVLG